MTIKSHEKTCARLVQVSTWEIFKMPTNKSKKTASNLKIHDAYSDKPAIPPETKRFRIEEDGVSRVFYVYSSSVEAAVKLFNKQMKRGDGVLFARYAGRLAADGRLVDVPKEDEALVVEDNQLEFRKKAS